MTNRYESQSLTYLSGPQNRLGSRTVTLSQNVTVFFKLKTYTYLLQITVFYQSESFVLSLLETIIMCGEQKKNKEGLAIWKALLEPGNLNLISPCDQNGVWKQNDST